MTQSVTERQERMTAWVEAMQAFKHWAPPPTTAERYEAAREKYATGEWDLEHFTAEVVTLLREGL